MRKGMSAEGAIIVVVIFGLVMVVLAVLYNALFTVGQDEFTKKECQLSLQLTKSVEKYSKIGCITAVENPVPLCGISSCFARIIWSIGCRAFCKKEGMTG